MLFSLVIWLPFINQAFTVDDTNFLALAAHAWPHPLALYNFQINWLGEEQRAYDILANPPLVPWYLALVSTVARGREWVYHLSFWPFMVLTLAGAYRLGRCFAPSQDPAWTMLWTAAAPGLIVAAHTVMPDLPLVACYLLGVALTIEAFDQDRPAFAIGGGLVAGCSALCRYSGMTVIPLLLLYVFLNRVRARTAVPAILAALTPITAWSLASYHLYGRVHWMVIAGFEGQPRDPGDLLTKMIYQCSSLALVIAPATLIALFWNPGLRRSMRNGAVVGFAFAIGFIVEPWLPRLLTARAAVLLVIALTGMGAIGVLMVRSVWQAMQAQVWRGKGGSAADGLFLTCWIVGMLIFNLDLAFASVRYLLPALVPTILLLQRAFGGESRAHRGWWLATGISFVLALLISVADQQFADVYRDYAASLPPVTQQRWFTGHWGWQYYMEKSGAHALSSSSDVQPGDEVIAPFVPYPQPVPKGLKMEMLSRTQMQSYPGLRTVTYDGAACFYAYGVAPSMWVWLPFGFTREPLDTITRWKVVSVAR